jgi:hypothetical protein
MSAFLLVNGWLPDYSNMQLYRYALRVARQQGNYPVRAIERWIRRNSELMANGNLRAVRRQNAKIRAAGDMMGVAFEPFLMAPNWKDDYTEEMSADFLADEPEQDRPVSN